MQVKLTIPSSLKDITLDQWMKFTIMTKDIEDEVFLMEKTVEILCNIPLETVRKIEYNSITRICNELSVIFSKEPELEKTFVMDGVEYSFIPQLDDITFGEYIDLDTFLSNPENIHKAMTVLFRPVKQKLADHYLIEDYDPARQKQMKRMPVHYALGALGFFLSLNRELLSNIQSFLHQETQNLTPQQRRDFQKNGAGIHQSITALEEASQNLMRSLHSPSQLASLF